MSEDRPPFATFEMRTVEDREASLAAGHYVGKEIAFAIITPAGSKDRIEKNADEWLKDLQEAVNQGRFNPQWLSSYRSIYKDWSEGREVPESGTAILTWPAISRSQQEAILNANIRTVEDLAEANEPAMNSIGMGARALKAQAIAWLEASQGTGKLAGKLEKLQIENDGLKAVNQALSDQVKSLQADIKTLQSKG